MTRSSAGSAARKVDYGRYEFIKVAQSDGVCTLTMDNPPHNAISPRLHTELSWIFRDINQDSDVKVVVLTGSGNTAFSAGGDIKEMARRREENDFGRWLVIVSEAREILRSALELRCPIVARVNGDAVGLGATLALLADFSLMLAAGRIADTHVNVGLAAGDGGALLWPLLVGFARARKCLLLGEMVGARQAEEWGLITSAYDTIDDLDKATDDLVARLRDGPTIALHGTKMALNLVLRTLVDSAIEGSLGFETESFLSNDHFRASVAFRDKQKFRFQGD